MATKKSDLYVITKAKELSKYVITVTEKSPKKYRFTLVVRLQNYSLDVIENLLMANMLPLGDERRARHQAEAGRLLELLGYFAMICMETTCILPKQFENISKLQAECLLFRLLLNSNFDLILKSWKKVCFACRKKHYPYLLCFV